MLILDEPTAALGVKEAGVVLRYIAQARARGLGVIFITHNIHHAYPIGDRFTLLNRGRSYGTFAKSEVTREEVVAMMAGGEELEELGHELEEFARTDRIAGAKLAETAEELLTESEHIILAAPQVPPSRRARGSVPIRTCHRAIDELEGRNGYGQLEQRRSARMATVRPFPAILNEMAAAGYAGTEYNAMFGSDAEQLNAELSSRSLRLAGSYQWLHLSDHETLERGDGRASDDDRDAGRLRQL